MAFTGEPMPKRAIQAALKPLGLKVVRTKAYEEYGRTIQPGEAAPPKVFCIGFNKTATTTLEQVLRGQVGLRMPKQLEQETVLADVIDRGTYDKLSAFCAHYDAFQDLPFSQGTTYVACDALFPDAKFILTERPPEAWADSYIRYYQREFGLVGVERVQEAHFAGKSLYLAPGYIHRVWGRFLTEVQAGKPVSRWDLAFDRDFLIERYVQRNADIKAHFADRPDALLVIDPTTDEDTGALLSFLGAEALPAAPFPHANASLGGDLRPYAEASR